MDQGSSSLLYVCVMMFCLLGAARCSNGDEGSCCPEIPPWKLTKIPPRICRQVDSIFRYECVAGFVREAGTSNRIQCKANANGDPQWTNPILNCKPDPKIKTTTQPPSFHVTMVQTDSIITTTVTAATTSRQTTQSISISASVTAETGSSTESTSTGLQALSDHTLDFERNTKATGGTTSTLTTAEPSNNSTVNHLMSSHKLDSTTTAIAFVSLVAVCTLIGIGFLFYRRRRQNNIPPHTPEEEVAMNPAPSPPAL